jgi:hypothetical protein
LGPGKQKLRELGQLQEAQELGEVAITYALERWLTTVKSESDSENEHTIANNRRRRSRAATRPYAGYLATV